MKPQDMIPPLAAHFCTEMLKHLHPWDHRVIATNVRFVEEMTIVNGIMFELDVMFDSLLMIELLPIVNKLDEYCVVDTENTDGWAMNGYSFLLGDGDDSGAVRFENGKFSIWLRGWKYEPLTQARYGL